MPKVVGIKHKFAPGGLGVEKAIPKKLFAEYVGDDVSMYLLD